jgi:hypothetical protein
MARSRGEHFVLSQDAAAFDSECASQYSAALFGAVECSHCFIALDLRPHNTTLGCGRIVTSLFGTEHNLSLFHTLLYTTLVIAVSFSTSASIL